jgi:GNAT superfamily N-acetyltransferase
MGEASERITVRRGRREDAATLAALHHEHAWCYDEASIVAEYYDDAFEPDTVIAAEIGGELVGKIELFLGWKSTSGRFGIIRRFVVHPDWRGRGIGHRLLAAAEDEARRAGCAFLELSVDEDNPGARRLYASGGFGEDRREIILRKPLDGQTHRSDTKGRTLD